MPQRYLLFEDYSLNFPQIKDILAEGSEECTITAEWFLMVIHHHPISDNYSTMLLMRWNQTRLHKMQSSLITQQTLQYLSMEETE